MAGCDLLPCSQLLSPEEVAELETILNSKSPED